MLLSKLKVLRFIIDFKIRLFHNFHINKAHQISVSKIILNFYKRMSIFPFKRIDFWKKIKSQNLVYILFVIQLIIYFILVQLFFKAHWCILYINYEFYLNKFKFWKQIFSIRNWINFSMELYFFNPFWPV